MPNWDNGLALLVVTFIFSWLLNRLIFDFLEKMNLKFDKPTKRKTLWLIFSIMFNLAIFGFIVHLLLFQWPR